MFEVSLQKFSIEIEWPVGSRVPTRKSWIRRSNTQHLTVPFRTLADGSLAILVPLAAVNTCSYFRFRVYWCLPIAGNTVPRSWNPLDTTTPRVRCGAVALVALALQRLHPFPALVSNAPISTGGPFHFSFPHSHGNRRVHLSLTRHTAPVSSPFLNFTSEPVHFRLSASP
jgi:hypothetical protein